MLPRICKFEPDEADLPPGVESSPCLRKTEPDSEKCFFHKRKSGKEEGRIRRKLGSLSGDKIQCAYFKGVTLSGDITLPDVQLPGANFANSKIEGATFEGTKLSGASFSDCTINHADFDRQTELPHTDFKRATITDTTFKGGNLEEADFSEAEVSDGKFQHAKGTNLIFEDTSLRSCLLFRSDLNGSSFSQSLIKDCDFLGANLSEADFIESRLHECRFTDANLVDTTFSDAFIDPSTSFGDRLLEEFSADRELEPKFIQPDCLEELCNVNKHRGRDLEIVEENIPDDSPNSAYEDIYTRKWTVFRWVTKPIRLCHRIYRHFSSEINDNKRLRNLDNAAETYSAIKSAYRSTPYTNEARKYNVREKECIRKKKILSTEWVWYSVSRWLMGYGENPWTVVGFGIVIWLLSMVAYSIGQLPVSGSSSHLTLIGGKFQLDVLYHLVIFSFRRLLTFSNGNYFEPTGLTVAIGILQSAIGKLIEAAIIFTLGRRATA